MLTLSYIILAIVLGMIAVCLFFQDNNNDETN